MTDNNSNASEDAMQDDTLASAGEPGPQHKARMSRGKKAFIWIVAVIAVLVLGGVALFYGTRAAIDNSITTIPDALPLPPVDDSDDDNDDEQPVPDGETVPQDPINILVLGSDSRASGGDPTDWQYGGQRSDVMMLVQVTGDRDAVNVMSIPRDSWVPIEGHGTSKINAAFSWGGAPLAVGTVQNLMGVQIDHIVILDFTSFEELTDQLGGVTIATSRGDRDMNGEEALSFVRERYSLPGGDFDRVRRQQAWIESILKEVFDQDILASVPKLGSMIQTVLRYSAVDEGLNFDSMLDMALELRSVRPGDVNFFTIPVRGTGMEGSQSVVYLDNSRLERVAEAWGDDAVSELIAEDPTVVRMLHSEPVY